MASIRKYSVSESNNVALGQAGCLFEDAQNAITGKKIIGIQFLEDTVFTTLTPQDGSYIGTADGNGSYHYLIDDHYGGYEWAFRENVDDIPSNFGISVMFIR